ncbi:MAG TPA: hypothetical protein VGR11_00910 [Solirubrobacteraceae bacterium]|nr:hypothetical protein [Solirubrobacteraceae bacterium]
MWKALKTVESEYAALGQFDVDDLLARAVAQREKIEAQRQKVAPLALTHTVNA